MLSYMPTPINRVSAAKVRPPQCSGGDGRRRCRGGFANWRCRSAIFGIQAKRQATRAVDAEQSALSNLATAEQTGRSLTAARKELRHTLYAAEMNLVQSAWDARQYDRARLLLERQRPEAGEDDLRGWEWHYWRRQIARGQLRSVEVPELAQLADISGFSAPLAFTSDGERLLAILNPPPPVPETSTAPRSSCLTPQRDVGSANSIFRQNGRTTKFPPCCHQQRWCRGLFTPARLAARGNSWSETLAPVKSPGSSHGPVFARHRHRYHFRYRPMARSLPQRVQ